MTKLDQYYVDIAEAAPYPIVIASQKDDKILYLNTRAEVTFGVSKEQAIGQLALDFYANPSDRVIMKEKFYQFNRLTDFEIEIKTPSRNQLWFLLSANLIEFEGITASISSFNDITELKRSEQRLRESNDLSEMIFEYSPGANFIMGLSGEIVKINLATEKLFGIKQKDAIGRKIFDFGIMPKESHEKVYSIFGKSVVGKPVGPEEVELARSNGEKMIVSVSTFPVKIKNELMVLGIVNDITEIKLLALKDSLTGLDNRRSLNNQAKYSFAQAKRNKYRIAVIALDLDKFKNINDSFGHDIGDRILVEAAARLREVVKREIDIVARIGGDEFVILLSAVEDNLGPKTVAERILAAFASPFALDDKLISVGISLGVAISSDDDDNLTMLHKKADVALYEAKESGRNKYVISGD